MFDYCIYRLSGTSYTSYFYNKTAKARVVFSIFDEPFFWSDSPENWMPNPNEPGLCGEYVCIRNRDDNVEIESSDWDNDEELPAVLIKKASLLKCYDLWKNFKRNGVPEIAITCDEEGNLDIVDRRSLPNLYMIDINKQSVDHKEYGFVLIMSFFFGRYYYQKMLDNDYNLSMLSELLIHDQTFVGTVERALHNQEDFTLINNDIAIIANGSCITIQPHNCYKPEAYAFTISKTELFNVIAQWNKVVNSRAKNIIIKRYENYGILIEEYHKNEDCEQVENPNSSSSDDIKMMTLDELKAMHSESDYSNENFVKACQEKFGPADEYRIGIAPDYTLPNEEELKAAQSLHNTIQKLIGHKPESLKMIKGGAFYHEDPQQVNARYLKMLIRVFDENNGWIGIVKNQLMSPTSCGVSNDLACVEVKDETVVIKSRPNYSLGDSIEIDRRALLDLISKWEDLIDRSYSTITFNRHEDGSITLTGQ